MPPPMPVLFFGHGNPMNAVSRNIYTEAWERLGMELPRPSAILMISAHWYGPGIAVTANTKPGTIHDFGGFPKELYRASYPAPGSPELAARVQQVLAPLMVASDESWGLDHGTWSVLCHVYPKADIPVVQLRLDETLPPLLHFDMGRKLSVLRDEGILVAGSGNLVHNLHTYAWGKHMPEPYPWAARFEAEARTYIQAGADRPLIDYEKLGPDAALAIPTPEHFLPLLYILGARRAGDAIRFPVEGMDGGSISMLAVQVG
jgi:4,5-DOPA dioxygenase extradiol